LVKRKKAGTKRPAELIIKETNEADNESCPAASTNIITDDTSNQSNVKLKIENESQLIATT
jgi:hypothetical protein